MFSERFQLLLSPEQRQRLERAARAEGRSVSALIRDAIDQRYLVVTPEEKRKAFERIAAMRAEVDHLTPEDINAMVAEERDAAI